MDAENRAFNVLLRTRPTTVAGATALLRYLHDHDAKESGRVVEDVEGMWACLLSIDDGLEAIAPAAA